MKLKNVFKSKHRKYYSGIDEMPLHNWMKCTNGDMTFIRIDTNDKSEINDNDNDAWCVIYDEYINTFGLGDIYLKLLKAMKKKAILELDFIISRNRFKLTEIEIEISKISTMLANGGKGITIEQSLIHLSKWIGHWINAKDITTKEYFNLINEHGKANKK